MNNDLISRSELKKALYDFLSENSTICDWDDIFNVIDNAPTVYLDSCGKCPYYKDSDRDIIAEAYNDGYLEGQKLVNNSQELVNDLVKEQSERPKGEMD